MGELKPVEDHCRQLQKIEDNWRQLAPIQANWSEMQTRVDNSRQLEPIDGKTFGGNWGNLKTIKAKLKTIEENRRISKKTGDT